MPRSAVSPALSTQSEKANLQTDDTLTNGAAVNGTRRSGRTTKRPMGYQDPDTEDELYRDPVGSTPAKRIKIVTRRNPPREAAAQISTPPDLSIPDQDEILEAAFAPLTSEEREQWTGWTEVESEPSYFNIILHELGIRGCKIQEVFGTDEVCFGFIPKPIYGIIFLYRIREDHEDDEAREPCPADVWFANQTTADACATVAMVNIALNCEDITLGENLEKFKAETRNLNPALRGHLLSFNDKIRVAHNSFARRMDVLNSDLTLKNDVDDEPKTKKRPKKSPAKKPAKVKKAAKDAAFHYIAYVPIGGNIWELDGLQGKPLCIGPIPPKDDAATSHSEDDEGDEGDDAKMARALAEEQREEPWVRVTREHIADKMAAYEDADNVAEFNLLALCHSRLDELRRTLAANIANMCLLDAKIVELNPAGSAGHDEKKRWIDARQAAELAEYKLTIDDVVAAPIRPDVAAKVATAKNLLDAADAIEIFAALQREQDELRADYSAENMAWEEDVSRAEGGKKDYAPAIHLWLKTLADKGELSKLME